MDLKYKPLNYSQSKSFYIERKCVPYFGPDWHYHEEYELILTLTGEGIRIIGDKIDQFESPELVLIGPNVPHLFKNREDNTNADCIVLKFKQENLPFLHLPELSKIQELLNKARRGILFSKKNIKKVKPLLIELSNSTKENTLINFLRVFDFLSYDEDLEFIASEKFALNFITQNEDRLQKILSYFENQYANEITLEELAEVAHMTKNAFCRYFKDKTGKTAFEFLREYRVNKACQMLINGNKSITQVCYDSGFNSFSSFTRVFRKFKNISASEFQNQFMQSSSVA